MKPLKAAPPEARLYFTRPEARTAFSLGETALDRAIKAGEIPVYRMGRRDLVKGADVEAYLARHAVRAEPVAA